MTNWEDLLAEFRTLGGVADNIRLGQGSFGRGLFVIDPGRPFLLRTPQNLLVDVSDVVFQNNALAVAPEAKIGARERRFIEAYNAEFSWGGGGRAEIERMFAQAQALPSELRHKLHTQYHCGDWFDEPSTELIQRLFIESREFGGLSGRRVMMPMIELANHGPSCSYDSTDGIALSGTASEEITVRYTEKDSDSYDIFRTWGFACEGNIAFSIELIGSAIGVMRLYVERQIDSACVGDRPVLPTMLRKGAAVKLTFLMLGNRKMPRLCRGNFRTLFRTSGVDDADEAFDKIRMINNQFFLALLAELEDLDGSMAVALRSMARFQLQELTYCFGAREL